LREDAASEPRKRLPKVKLAEGVGRADADRGAESERVEATAEAALEVLAQWERRVELVRDASELLSVDQRDARRGRQLAGDTRASGAFLSGDRPDGHGECTSIR
jgi:hypothetical protein